MENIHKMKINTKKDNCLVYGTTWSASNHPPEFKIESKNNKKASTIIKLYLNDVINATCTKILLMPYLKPNRYN